MTNRFQQDLEGIIVNRSTERAITTYRGLLKQLGAQDEPAEMQHKLVQDWVDQGHSVNRSLYFSLDEEGIHFPLQSGAAIWRR